MKGQAILPPSYSDCNRYGLPPTIPTCRGCRTDVDYDDAWLSAAAAPGA